MRTPCQVSNSRWTLHRASVWFVQGLILVVAVAGLAGCSPSDRGHTDRHLVVTGSSTIAPLVSEIAKQFETQHPGVRVDVQSGGSSRGVADVRREIADVGMVSRALHPEEKGLTAWTIARDGVCLIVHRDNPVVSLTREQITAIYTGRIKNWREVGGTDSPITVVTKAEGRSTLELFLLYFRLDAKQIQADSVIGDNEQGIKTVAGNPHAIGYVSIGTAEYDANHEVAIKLLPLEGVDASIESVQDNVFPLVRPLNLVVKGHPQGIAAKFIDFARSKDVHQSVTEQCFVPLKP